MKKLFYRNRPEKVFKKVCRKVFKKVCRKVFKKVCRKAVKLPEFEDFAENRAPFAPVATALFMCIISFHKKKS